MHHWTLQRSKRHAGARAETEIPNGRHLITVDGSGARNHLVQYVFAFQDIGLVSRCQTVERFVEPCSLLVSKHAAVRFPSALVLYLLSCLGGQGGVDGRSAVPCHVWHQWLDNVSQPCRLDHFAPRHHEVVITKAEDAFRGVFMAERCCAPGTVQLDRVVGRICFGPQRSVFWVKKHLMTVADSLFWNLDVSSLNGQWLPWPEVARHHPQQVNAHAPVPLPQKFQNLHCPYAPHKRVSAPRRGTAFPTLEGTTAAWQEKTPVFPELRKVVTHCPKLDVAGRASVLHSIFLVEEGHEHLVELCIRDERVFCHQSVLEELLQGLVVANGVFHCVNFQEGEGFFGMPAIVAVRFAISRRLFRHTWALVSSSEVVASDLSFSLSFVSIPVFSRDSILLIDRGFSVLKQMFVLLIEGSTTRFRRARKHRTFVSIVQGFIFTKGVGLSKRLFEKSCDPCWDMSCRLEGSSEQLLSLAIHPSWNLIW